MKAENYYDSSESRNFKTTAEIQRLGTRLTPNYSPLQKKLILDWMNVRSDIGICKAFRDPLTQEVYQVGGYLYKKSGFTWTDETRYLIQQYDAPVSAEFFHTVFPEDPDFSLGLNDEFLEDCTNHYGSDHQSEKERGESAFYRNQSIRSTMKKILYNKTTAVELSKESKKLEPNYDSEQKRIILDWMNISPFAEVNHTSKISSESLKSIGDSKTSSYFRDGFYWTDEDFCLIKYFNSPVSVDLLDFLFPEQFQRNRSSDQRLITKKSVPELREQLNRNGYLRPNYDQKTKEKILEWMSVDPGVILDFEIEDPLTKKNENLNSLHVRKGYFWSDEMREMIQVFNAPVDEDFLREVFGIQNSDSSTNRISHKLKKLIK